MTSEAPVSTSDPGCPSGHHAAGEAGSGQRFLSKAGGQHMDPDCRACTLCSGGGEQGPEDRELRGS